MPIMPMILPLRADFGDERPLRASMKHTAEAIYASCISCVDMFVRPC